VLILAIDIGNSRIKWGLARDQNLLVIENAALEEEDAVVARLRLLPMPQRVVVANVAGDKGAFILKALPNLWPTSEVIKISALPFAAGITNTYDPPESLGVDRFAALVGAWHLFRRACLIANVGTALTVDCLDDHGVFVGGVIVPGMRLLGKALSQYTAGVKKIEGVKKDLPQTTGDAVTTGSVLALAGTITLMREKFLRVGPHEVILTGGDATVIGDMLTFPYRMAPNIVLQGLVELALAAHLFQSRSPVNASKSCSK
jgi:type III pantothenate kinase